MSGLKKRRQADITARNADGKTASCLKDFIDIVTTNDTAPIAKNIRTDLPPNTPIKTRVSRKVIPITAIGRFNKISSKCYFG
ncbi:MAG: hypothetical protein RR911_05435 [Oscillospiraceae bacterium]